MIPFAALLAGGTAIGFAGVLMRLSDVNPIASAFWRMAIAAPILWGWAWARERRDAADGKRIAVSGVVMWAGALFAADMALWHLALHYTTVSNATLLSNLAPIFIALWVWAVYRIRFTRLFLVGLVATLAGASLLVGPSAAGGAAGDAKMLGDGLGFGSAIFYAAYQLVIKDAREQYSTARLMAWSTTVTAVLLLPLALLSPGLLVPARPAGWLPLVALALVAQIAGQTVIAYALAHLPASLASVSLLIQPLTATIAAWLILGEAVGLAQVAGGGLLLGGIYLSKTGTATTAEGAEAAKGFNAGIAEHAKKS